MTQLINFILQVNWGEVLSVLSLIGLLLGAGIKLAQELHIANPATKNVWLQRAVQVGMTLEQKAVDEHVPAQTMPLIVDSANAFLKLHGISARLDTKTAELVLADLLNTLKAK